MTLSNEAVLSQLGAGFVCGQKNILGESYAGVSGAHELDDPAYWTTNGAGPHNMQIFFLSSDGTVLHCLPGFWAPEDLLHEAELARQLDGVWKDASLTRAEKDARFRAAHLAHLREHSAALRSRSRLQGFDAKHEEKLAHSDFRFAEGDFRPSATAANGKRKKKGPELKTTDQVMHERMATRPFVAYESFDVAAFSEYGKIRYDKAKFDGSEPWPDEVRAVMKSSAKRRRGVETAKSETR